MESSSVAINTAISFILHSLEEIKKSGYEKLSPLIDQIEILHKKFRETESVDYIYKIITSVTDYETYRDTLGVIFTKLCETIFFIIGYIKNKSLCLYELMVLKLFEFYQYLLKNNVKTYTKFEELDAIIVYIRDDLVRDGNRINMKEKLKELSYDDAVLRILVSLLSPPEGNFSSFVELLDSILLPNTDMIDKINSTLKDLQITIGTVVSSDSNETLSPLELLKLKKQEKKDKLTKSKEKLMENDGVFDLENQISNVANLSPELIKDSPSKLTSIDSCSENSILIEKPVFTSIVKSSDSFVYKSCIVSSSDSIIKDTDFTTYENPNDRLNRILNKYSKKAKVSMDKSPPQGTNSDSMIRVMSERKFYS